MSKYNYSSTVVPVFIEKKEEQIEVHPTEWSAQAANSNGSKLVFDVTSYSYPADLFNAEFEVIIKLESAAGTIITDQNIALINNFFPAMFDRMELVLNGEKVEELDEPFIISTISKFITKSKDYVESDGEIEGFIPDAKLSNTAANTNTGRELRKLLYNNAPTRTFQIKYKLRDLFHFCSDYRKPIYKLPFKITLTRSFTDDTNKFLFHNADGAANQVGRAIIENIVLKVPINELNIKPQADFELQFNGKKEIDIIFNQANLYKGEVTGNGNKTILVTTATQPPELVVLVFQPQTYEYTDNTGLFKTGDIETIELRIGNTQKYPYMPLPINITESFYQNLYQQYSDTCKIYGNEALLSYIDFKNNYPMYVFNTLKQDRDVFSAGATINFYLKKSGNTVYKWNVLYLENTWYKSKLLPNGMSRPQLITYNSK